MKEITWSHNLTIFSRCETIEEKEFYIHLTKKERWSVRELDRQISSSLFERTMINDGKLSNIIGEIYPKNDEYFID